MRFLPSFEEDDAPDLEDEDDAPRAHRFRCTCADCIGDPPTAKELE